jgi:hypothetical protein
VEVAWRGRGNDLELQIVSFGIPAARREDIWMAVAVRVDDSEQRVRRREPDGAVDACTAVN